MNVVALTYNNCVVAGDGVIEWTRFVSRDSTTCTTHAMSLDQLAHHLVEAGPYREKLACPWIKLAKFGDQRTGKGAIRNNDNVLAITGVEGDYDGGVITPEQAVEMLERANIRAIVYTSPSHRPHAPRWRVLAPLSQSCPPSDRTLYLARVNGALGGVLASESFTLSQSYFYGEVVGAEYRVFVTFDDPEEALCIDQLPELDDVAIRNVARAEPGAAPARISIDLFADAVEEKGRLLRTGDARREMLKTYIASRSARGLSGGEIRAMVAGIVDEYFDPNDVPDARDLAQIIDHYTARDGAHTQPADISAFTGKLQGGRVDPETGEVLPDEPRGLSKMVRIKDLLLNRKKPEWLIRGLLAKSHISVLYGASYTGKSYVAVDFACHVAIGKPWRGNKTLNGGVFYVAGEGNSGLTDRVMAWAQKHNISKEDMAEASLAISHSSVMIDNPAAVRELEADIDMLVQEYGDAALIIVDTLARNFEGDENSAQDIGAFINGLDYLRNKYNAHIMFVHHTGKKGDLRGSSALLGNPDARFKLELDAGANLLLTNEKLKDSREHPPIEFRVETIELGEDEDGELLLAGVAAEGHNVLHEVLIQAQDIRGKKRDAVTVGDILTYIGQAEGSALSQVALEASVCRDKQGVTPKPFRNAIEKLRERLYIDKEDGKHTGRLVLTEDAKDLLRMRGTGLKVNGRDPNAA